MKVPFQCLTKAITPVEETFSEFTDGVKLQFRSSERGMQGINYRNAGINLVGPRMGESIGIGSLLGGWAMPKAYSAAAHIGA
jgi:hypothetical protein